MERTVDTRTWETWILVNLNVNCTGGSKQALGTWHKVSISNHCAALNEFSLCYLLTVLLFAGLVLSFIKMNFFRPFPLRELCDCGWYMIFDIVDIIRDVPHFLRLYSPLPRPCPSLPLGITTLLSESMGYAYVCSLALLVTVLSLV